MSSRVIPPNGAGNESDPVLADLVRDLKTQYDRNAALEADRRVYREMVHAALDALHLSVQRRAHLRRRIQQLVDELRRCRRGAA